MISLIASRDNKILKTVRSLNRKKGREAAGRYFAEGYRLSMDALEHTEDMIDCIIASESFYQKNEDFIKGLDIKGKIVYITKDRLFNEAAQTETPQGIAAVMRIPDATVPDMTQLNFVLMLDGVAEPGNMGTIIRTAEAAGIDCIMLGEGCADIYAPKVVRAAMGSVFRMKFCRFDVNTVEEMKSCGFTVAATALHNSRPAETVRIDGRRAIVIGSEAHGVSEEVLAAADIAVRIDMCGRVESLNAAVAAGIAMYMLRPQTQRG